MHHKPVLNVVLAAVLLFCLPGGIQHASAGTFTTCAAVVQIPAAECNALVALYTSTNGASWTDHTNWLVTDTPGDWHGVTVQSASVFQIALVNNGLTGSIPTQLGSLTNLYTLNLNVNHLSGSIPAQLGNLTNLHILGLGSNQLTGSIPNELGNLTNLQDLWLYGNQLTGGIPNELGSLTNLTYLELNSNQLSGSIPVQLSSLANLLYLELESNQLSGSIPPQLGALTKLVYLGLYYNQLSGSVPPELGSLANLEILLLSSNQFSGSIPLSFTALTKLNNFSAASTWLCEPQDAAFQTWKSTVTTWSSPGLCYTISGHIKNGANPLAGVTISNGTAYVSTTSAADGTYTLANLPPKSYTLTPALAGYTFKPVTRTVVITNANITGQDFSAPYKFYVPLVKRQ